MRIAAAGVIAAGLRLLLLSSSHLLDHTVGAELLLSLQRTASLQFVSGSSLTHISPQGLKWRALGDFTADPHTPVGHRRVKTTKPNTFFVYLGYSYQCLYQCLPRSAFVLAASK